MYKIIAIDLDGTLLDNEKRISKINQEAIIDAQQNGAMVVLATGRPLTGIKKYFEELHFKNDTYAINFNGGLISSVDGKHIIKCDCLNGDDAKEIYDLSLKLGVNIHAFDIDQNCISPKESRWTIHEVTLNDIPLIIKDFNTLTKKDEIIKIMLVDDPEVLSEAIKKIPQRFKEKYNIVQSAPFFLEFLNKKTDKWYGIVNLAKHLNVSLDEIMTFGDSENDLLMVKECKMGVAMANATKDVLDVASYICESNIDSGVGKTINKYVNKK